MPGRAPGYAVDPYFQAAPPSRPAGKPAQPARTAANDRYLPPMPEMLKPPSNPSGEKAALVKDNTTPLYDKPPVQVPPRNGDLIVRGKGPDEPPAKTTGKTKITIPSPEELGLLDSPRPRAFDWNAVKSEMKQLGASHYRLENDADGAARFVCALPHPSDPNKQRQFEARAETEAEAVRLVMEQAEAWKRGK